MRHEPDENHKLPAAKPRYIRDTGSSSENDHLWSVAYSDMLMVLLGFFVIFFSQGKSQKTQIIDQIATELKGNATQKAGRPANDSRSSKTAKQSNQGQLAAIPNIDQVAKDLDLTYETTNTGKTIRINFPNNTYGKRRYQLNSSTQKKMKRLITVLSPYKEKLKIHFIGHSDKQKVSVHSEKFTNNFQLSALRATQAALFFQKHGFPSSNIITSGAADNINASRSLSITISSKHFLQSH